MDKKYTLNYLEGAADDYKELDGSQRVFVKGLDRIATLGMKAGSPLHG